MPLHIVEWLLCTVVAVALCYTVQGGFNVGDEFHGAVWLHAIVCLVVQGALLVSTLDSSRRIATSVGYAVVTVVACGVAVVLSPVENPIADVPQNHFVAVVVYAVVNLLVHVLSRAHGGCVALFGAGAFTCGLIQFLYTTNMLVATAVFLLSSVMLISLRSYMETAGGTPEGGMPLFGRASAVGALLPVVAGVIAAIVVFGVIMPLNPPHATIKLFDEYVSYEEERVKTAVEFDEDADKRITSSTIDETLPPRTTTDKKLDENSEKVVAPQDAPKNGARDYLSSEYSDVDLSGLAGNMRALALNPSIPWAFIIACIVAGLILLLTLPRFIVHKVRLRRIVSQPPKDQVRLFYRFFLERFKKIGLEKPAELSAVEYANQFRPRLAPFVGAQEAGSFDHLTALLVNQECAGVEPDQEDLDCMKWLYSQFYARCRKKFGLLNYGFRRFTL